MSARSARALAAIVLIVALAALVALRARERGGGAVEPSAERVEAGASEQAASLDVAPHAPPGASRERAPGRDDVSQEQARDSLSRLRLLVTWGDDGAPAAGVAVQVVMWSAPDPHRSARMGTSDAEGVIELDELHPGSASLYGDRGGNGDVELAAGETTEASLAIPAGIELLGRVLAPEGAPVPGASVFLSDYGNDSRGTVVTVCDAAGRYTIRGIGEARCVAAFAPGFAPSACVDVEGDPGERVELDVVLGVDGAALEGRVRAPDGAPAEGVELLVGEAPGTPHFDAQGIPRQPVPPRSLASGADGSFAAEGLVAELASVAARAAGSAPWSGSVELRAGERARLEIALVPEASIRGRVLDARGAPAAGVWVEAGEYGVFGRALTRSEADGSYRLGELEAGEVRVRATDEARGGVHETLTLSAGIETQWDARLVPGGVLGGVVIDEQGTPLAGFDVRAEVPDQPGSWLQRTSSDASGRFLLESCPSEEFVLAVHEPNGNGIEPALELREFELGNTELVLRVLDARRATAWVTGRVIGPDGARPSAVELAASWGGMTVGVELEELGTDGRFRAGPFVPGALQLEFSARGLSEMRVQVENLRAAEERELGDVRLLATGSLSVHLARADGAPVDERVRVTLERGELGDWKFLPHAHGIALAHDLAPGSWTVCARGKGLACATATIEVRAGEDARLDLTLAAGVDHLVRLTFPAGTSPGPTELRVLDRFDRAVITDAFDLSDPIVPIESLAPGRYVVVITTEDGLVGISELVVESLTAASELIEIELR